MCSPSSYLLITATVSLVMCWWRADAETSGGSCAHAEQYMRSESIDIMTLIKRRYVGSIASVSNVAAMSAYDVSPCLSGDCFVDLNTAQFLQQSTSRRQKRALFVDFTAIPNHKWATNIPVYFNFTGVSTGWTGSYTCPALKPYQFGPMRVPECNHKVTDTLRSALRYVEQQTCLRFPTATDFSQPYLSVIIGDSCTTFLGKSTDTNATPFIVTRRCANTFSELIRMLANVLGMAPENQRQNRDTFIYINNSNIDSRNLANLQPLPSFVQATAYDYASITHVYSKQFARGAGYTVMPYDPLYLKVIGQRVEWSFLDAKAVNFYYCNSVCSNSLSCQRGGYVDPNNCAQCRCPHGFAGTTCQSLAAQSHAGCEGQQELTATASDQYITSPGYGSRYQLYTNCTWRISAPSSSSMKIQLKFVDSIGLFEDLITATCCHWVEIRYSGSINNTGPRFCGHQTPPNSIVTDAREVLVLFRSNYNADSVENIGFKLLYRLVTCDPAWSGTVQTDTNSLGARPVSQPLSASGCRDHCAYDLPGCVAVDIDKNQRPYPGCWTHDDPANLAKVYLTRGVEQHRLNDTYPECRVSTTAPTTSTVSGVCVPWRSFPSTNSLGASKLSGVTTLEACRAACEAEPRCVAVDWDATGGDNAGCWLHDNRANIQKQYGSPGVTQWQLTRCPTTTVTTTTVPTTTTTTTAGGCVPTFITRRDQHSVGADASSTLKTEDSCKNWCARTSNCFAVEWNNNTGVCWVHTNANNLQRIYGMTGVTQYEVVTRCLTAPPTPAPTTTTTTTTAPTATSFPPTPPPAETTTCTPVWATYDNRNSINGIRKPRITTVQACRAACLADPLCKAIDWNRAGPIYCWLHQVRNGPYTTENVTQHVLVTRCQTSPEVTTTVTTTTTTMTTTTTSAECIETWTSRVGVNSVGGQPQAGLTTLSQCQAACIANYQCVAVDWNSRPRPGEAACWIHTNANRRHFATPGVTQYELTKRCTSPPTTTETPECRPTWIIRNNTHSAGATLIVEPISAAECLSRCAVTASCVAVDLLTSCEPPQCWMHHNRNNLRYHYRGVNVTQYEVATRCAIIAPPVSGGCGGVGAFPGQLCQPCIVQVSPPRYCAKRRWVRRGWSIQLVTVYILCQTHTCTSGAHLAQLQGVQTCVWVGWTSWSSCSHPCRGQQHRSYWHLARSHYSISQTQRRSCNTWC